MNIVQLKSWAESGLAGCAGPARLQVAMCAAFRWKTPDSVVHTLRDKKVARAHEALNVALREVRGDLLRAQEVGIKSQSGAASSGAVRSHIDEALCSPVLQGQNLAACVTENYLVMGAIILDSEVNLSPQDGCDVLMHALYAASCVDQWDADRHQRPYDDKQCVLEAANQFGTEAQKQRVDVVNAGF